MRPTLAIRFDVDSIRCIEEGIPNLRDVAAAYDVRFTFFINMGYSFNLRHTLRHYVEKRRARPEPNDDSGAAPKQSLGAMDKLGVSAILRTIILNPQLGHKYRGVFDALHADGHELGLHGGTDHVIWQRSLLELSDKELRDLFRPAFETFKEWWGSPTAFASPGFVHDHRVLALLDEYDFEYSSDMSGDEPFRPDTEAGHQYNHFQIPVTVAGAGNVPIIEESLAQGMGEGDIVDRCVSVIESQAHAVLYGHPFVEGVHASILDQVIQRVIGARDIVTMDEYLRRWRADRDKQAS